mmetsp:Transcript_16476/g.33993  ORF Transcript_16476/g.33993 Transcript_16476/m.33993 type:complete len:223 (-) Transcript_16476:34-702(-)
MKAPTMMKKNPFKLLTAKSTRGKNKFDDASVDGSSASFSIDGSNHNAKRTSNLFAVHFEESQNTVHECAHDMTVEEIANELWYTPEENEEMKAANQYSTKVARRTASAGAASADSYVGALEQVYECCCQGKLATQELQQALQTQLQLQPARTGLEQKVVKSVANGRQSRREQMTQLVYNIQSEHPHLSKAELAKLMQKQSSQISLPARLFALQVAQASSQQC